MSNKKIFPSKQDFDRAKAALRKIDSGLSDVRESVLRKFRSKGMHEFFLLYSEERKSFGGYIFLHYDKQVREMEGSSLSAEIQDVILAELEGAGRGSRSDIRLALEFDSHERVVREYDGDYFSRLR